MNIEEIKKLPYSLLVYKLPSITSSFSVEMYESRNFNRGWNRIHNRRIVKKVIIPYEIEEYIIKEILNFEKYLESELNIANLIHISWYISYTPFEKAILELIEKIISSFENSIFKNTAIIVENLRRNSKRKFDLFFINDLIWLLGVYYNSIINGSKIITHRNIKMESNFPFNSVFPYGINIKNVLETDSIDIFKDIVNYLEYDCIFYITKTFGYYENSFKRLESIVKNNYNSKTVVIIIEIRPRYEINQEEYEIHFLQGYNGNNCKRIEKIINEM